MYRFLMYNFYQTETFLELDSELIDAVESNEIDDAVDIFLEICQERENFEDNLPDWYKLRWSREADEETLTEVDKEYAKNIYGWS